MTTPSQRAGLALVALLAGCAPKPGPSSPASSAPSIPVEQRQAQEPSAEMNPIAESYVKLVLAVGQHDADYVDAYYGPPEWRTGEEAAKRPLPAIRNEAVSLLATLEAHPAPAGDEMAVLRHRYLSRQLQALVSRVDMLSGTKLSFDQESRALYDAVAPTHAEADFERLLGDLERRLPGEGPLPARLERFRQRYAIPPDRLDAVFTAAIRECRERTARHFALPAGESFEVEYVTGKPWSGYNWYKGGYHSLIQVNTELPIFIDRAVDLACHEGYPGHHAYNALLEQHLVRDRGWVELSVYPLFSPQSLIAEGTANYGIEVAFPGDERLAFERDALYPLAGLDPATAAEYTEVQELLRGLDYAGNEAARRYLDGRIDAARAADWLVRYTLTSPERAAQRVRFFDTYRSYVINYNLGRDLVRSYIEKQAGDDAEKRWQEFERLLSSPRLPSDLR